MSQNPMLRLEGVTKRFKPPQRGMSGTVALQSVSLQLMAGQTLGLVGPDGAGKSTLLRVLAGLSTFDQGEVEVLGKPVSVLDRSKLGYMPQGGGLYHELTVEQNLALYARLRDIEPGENPDWLDHLYTLVGLNDFKQRPAGRLSGGMRQKLALACAVVASPQLMLLDEPSVGVDPVSRGEIWQLARELAGPETCMVWATSILDDADQCDEVLVLHEGRVLYSGLSQGLSAQANGQVFHQSLPHADRRDALRALGPQASTISAVIEGDGVRLLMRGGNAKPAASWSAVPPRADDGFAILLDDGQPLQESKLALAFPVRDMGLDQPPSIVANGLSKRFGAFVAARDISFTVSPGEIFGLLGPNGAGKSTTFRMLCGLVVPSSGQAQVAGHDIARSLPKVHQSMGYMPQKFSLYQDLNIEQNLRFVAGAYGLSRAQSTLAIDSAVQALNLDAFLKTPSRLLPLGIRQRLSLAAAILHSPKVLFLDEPTSGVDPLLRREFWHHINAIAARGVAVLVTTHFMDEAENCDRLLLINQSETVAQGTPDALKRRKNGEEPHATLEAAFISLILSQRMKVKEAA